MRDFPEIKAKKEVVQVKEEIEKPEKIEKKAVKQAEIVDVPTQHTPMIRLEDGETIVDSLDLQVLIYNKLLKIERSVA